MKPKKVEGGTNEVATVLAENERLRGKLKELEAELEEHRKARLKLEQQVATIDAQAKRYFDQFVEVEVQSSSVANLYVASFRLNGTLDRKEVLSAIQEIVINLIGSEELAVFEPKNDLLKLG